MSVADVPGRPLSTWLKSCSDALASLCLCHVLALDVLHDLSHQRGGVVAVHKDSGTLHQFHPVSSEGAIEILRKTLVPLMA
jgi:hypothetical protein